MFHSAPHQPAQRFDLELRALIRARIPNACSILALTSMSSLSQAHDEVLEHILRFTDLTQVALLMCCGDAALNTRIARCYREVITPPSLRTATLWKLPSICFQLPHLKRLKIRIGTLLHSHISLIEEVMRLPSCLTELSLRTFGADKIISPLSTLHLDSSSEAIATNWLSTLFPLIQKIEAVTGQSMANDAVQNIGNLPRSLTSLVLDACSLDLYSVKSLPLGLTHLWGPVATDLETIELLPRSLRTGNFIDFETTAIRPSWGPDALPPLLEDLHREWRYYDVEFRMEMIPWTTFIPRTLTKLAVFSSNEITAQELCHLPHTITELSLNIKKYNLEDYFSTHASVPWPSALRKLTLGHTADLSSKDTHLLPQKITELHFPWGTSRPRATPILDAFPPSLTTLDIPGRSEWAPTQLSTIALTRLRLDFKIAPDRLKFLPKTLLDLYLYNCRVQSKQDAHEVAQLPRSLQKLAMEFVHYSALPNLPSSLSTLISTDILPVGDSIPEMMELPASLEFVLWQYSQAAEARPVPPWLSSRLIKTHFALERVVAAIEDTENQLDIKTRIKTTRFIR